MPTKVDELKEEIYKGDNTQKICDFIIGGALEVGSSDIHIEPMTNSVRLRYRVDGSLREIIEYPVFLHAQIIARYKIMSGLKIDESRKPQDGRISTTIDGKALDLRVSSLPTVSGEKIVMRIVDKSKKIPELENLGVEGRNGILWAKAISMPNGVVLTSGPTGSGKSTTLYSSVNKLNTPDVNIMTLEDPVENVLDGINQSQVHPDIGYTFATGLKTALRQDPDIILVGEIRDKETIDIAIEASLTGHLVLSTIHTNSAAETITRIINMGIQPFLLPAAINAIMAQRLIRRLCKHCKKEIRPEELDENMQKMIKKAIARTPKDELLSRVGEEILKNPIFYTAVGCPECQNVGYKGRVGMYEVLEITPKVKHMILKGNSGIEINDAAIEDGMISLEQDGIMKALNGHTSLEEVYEAAKENA
ncbi:MAG: GspE/PulE family protein [Candidatus Gracilibacteria bacterium]|nr:GspE/PulE family protein [Candidatus Gracilibacteria bacterium]MDD3120094.1 GspE/PulE family protein [Candidatus Gracilibacteria bacterium]MDD4530731.1 GspE/PulE family protein [Candidatus Gracilibacteria bacterium]